MKEELAKIHRAKGKKYDIPGVELGEGEYVELMINRSKLGLILIWAGEAAGFVVLTIILVLFSGGGTNSTLFPLSQEAIGYLYLMIFALYAVLILSGAIGTKIYRANHLFVTNKRVIQRSTTSLFARSLNIIDLASIEDVRFEQKNVFDRVCKVGMVRMSTVGDESTYTFPMVDVETNNMKTVTRLVHEAKKRKKD